jgi:hypothetical protein
MKKYCATADFWAGDTKSRENNYLTHLFVDETTLAAARARVAKVTDGTMKVKTATIVEVDQKTLRPFPRTRPKRRTTRPNPRKTK